MKIEWFSWVISIYEPFMNCFGWNCEMLGAMGSKLELPRLSETDDTYELHVFMDILYIYYVINVIMLDSTNAIDKGV